MHDQEKRKPGPVRETGPEARVGRETATDWQSYKSRDKFRR